MFEQKTEIMLSAGHILPLKVLVKEIPKPEKTAGGIILAPTAKIPTILSEVILTGEGTNSMQMYVKKGDKILHSPHSFVPVEIDGTDYRLLNQQDILYIFD